MNRRLKNRCTWMLILSIVSSALLTGCQPMQPYYLNAHGDCDLSHYVDTATDIEYTDVCQDPLEEVTQSRAPRTISNPQLENVEWWDLTLEQAMAHALQNSKVIRTYGQVRQFGQIVGGPAERLSAAPDSVVTVFDPALQETAQNGVEQVLSNFDAVFNSSISWDNTDRPQNFSGGQVNAPIFQQDRVTIDNEITKRSATGAQYFFRNQSIYTGSNNALTATTRAPGVPSDWFTAFEFEVRQPLLQNRGTQVNRIPIVLARIRTDLSLIDFQGAVAELLNSVERAYWELYFFYYNLEAAKMGRDSAQAAWQKVDALADGGEADKVAQAQEQYYFFRDRVEQAQVQLFKSENRIRYLMGLAPTDHRLIRPTDQPTTARISYNWGEVVREGLCRSPGTRRQGWRIKTREMELIAARNQLLPRFDAVALYRILGVGDEFNVSDRNPPTFTPLNQLAPGSSAVDSLWAMDNEEFRMGVELEIPLGFRRAMTQVRNSEMSLARERAKLQDMELEIVHQLTDAVQDLDANYVSLKSNFNRRVASEKQVAALEVAYIAGTTNLDLLLDAQRRQSEATVAYLQALVNYNMSMINMQLRKGTLLEYNGVQLAEGPWPAKAYFDAANRARRRDASHYLDYGFSRPKVISRGKVSDRCEKAIQPAMFTDDPYLGAGDGDVEYTGTDDDKEPTPAEDPDSGSLDDLTDSMDDGDSKPKPNKNLDDLPDIPEPKRATPPEAKKPADGELPAPRKAPELDDLEAARPRRTASRSKSVPPTPGGPVQIKWKD